MTESSVRKWIKADQTTNGITPQNSLSDTVQQELVRLRTENKRLKIKRDIQKMYGLPLLRKLRFQLATNRLRQCIWSVCGSAMSLVLMGSAQLLPHKAVGFKSRFFS